MCQTVTQFIAYCESVYMATSRCMGATFMARRIAVSSARWFVWRGPGRGSEMFLLGVLVSRGDDGGGAWVSEGGFRVPGVFVTKPDANASDCGGFSVAEGTAIGVYP